MEKQRRLVFCGAHPDDESFGFGSILAQYAAQGVQVFCVCFTGGEAGTVDAEFMKGYSSVAELRRAELKCAAEALGLAGVFYLGYRDSGMKGSEDNNNPDSLVKASLDEVAGRLVTIFRQLKPDVIITHDAGGGYGHPDHIVTHNAVVKAFLSAGDPFKYPGAGPVFQPAKLYFGVMPHGLLKMLVRLMPIFGKDPRHYGRNKDIDLTQIVRTEYPVHAVIKLKNESIKVRDKAAACHASQGGGRPSQFSIFRLIRKFNGRREYFMRAYPIPSRNRETDLFEGI